MAPWLIVLLLGVAGGILGTILPRGMELRFPGPIAHYLEGHHGRTILAHLLRNIVFGGVSSLGLWLIYNEQGGFEATRLAGRFLILSVLAGAGGTHIFNSYLTRGNLTTAGDNLAGALDKAMADGDNETKERGDVEEP